MPKKKKADTDNPVGQYPENVTDPKPQSPIMQGEPTNKTLDE